MLEYILEQCPQEYNGKENWLGVKMSPHSPMMFINKVTKEGIETNEGFYDWDGCSKEVIGTIYQRMRLNEKKFKEAMKIRDAVSDLCEMIRNQTGIERRESIGYAIKMINEAGLA